MNVVYFFFYFSFLDSADWSLNEEDHILLERYFLSLLTIKPFQIPNINRIYKGV
jgi:hypothetical protein